VKILGRQLYRAHMANNNGIQKRSPLLFSSWNAALEAAGLDPVKIHKKPEQKYHWPRYGGSGPRPLKSEVLEILDQIWEELAALGLDRARYAPKIRAALPLSEGGENSGS